MRYYVIMGANPVGKTGIPTARPTINIPQPTPQTDILEEPQVSPIKPTKQTRVIRHGFQQKADLVVRKIHPQSRSAKTSPVNRGQLQQASAHLFDFAHKLIEEKTKFLHKRKQEEMKLLKAREDLIKEQLQLSRIRGDSSVLKTYSSQRGFSQPGSPVRPPAALQWEAEDLVSEAEQRLNKLNEASFFKQETLDVSKAAFPGNVSSIHKTPPRGRKPNTRTQSSPSLVKVDLSSASKYRRPRPKGSPKSPEVKDLLVLLQDSSIIDDSPLPRKPRHC